MAQPSVFDAFLPDPNAIQEEQNQSIDKNLTGTLSQRGSAVGQLFARALAGNPIVQNAVTVRQAATDAMTGVAPQGNSESDLDYQLRTTHAMYNAVAPYDTNTAMRLADRLVTLKEMQNQQSLLTEREQEAKQTTAENRLTKGTLVVGDPTTGQEYGNVSLFNPDGTSNTDWQSQRDKMLQTNKGSVWRTEEQWSQMKAAIEAQKLATKLTMAQMKGGTTPLDPATLSVESDAVMRDLKQLRVFASYGQTGQDMRNQIMGDLTHKLNLAGMSMGELMGLQAQARGQQIAIDKLAPQLAQTSAYEKLADFNADRVAALAPKVNLSSYTSVNDFLQWAGKQKGNGDAAELSSVIKTFQTEAARILTAGPTLNGVLSDTARHEIAQIADGSLAPKALNQVLNRLKVEFAVRTGAYKEQMDNAQNYIATMGGRLPANQAPNGQPVAQPQQQPAAQAAAPAAAPNRVVKFEDLGK